MDFRGDASAQNDYCGCGVTLHTRAGFNGLFFPALKEQQLALAERGPRCGESVRSLCHCPGHDDMVHVQISCPAILPPGATRSPPSKKKYLTVSLRAWLPWRGRGGVGGCTGHGEKGLWEKWLRHGDMAGSERHCPGRSNPVTHCCHSAPGSLPRQPDIKGCPIPSYMLFISQSAHSSLHKALGNPLLAGGHSSWCPSASAGQQRREAAAGALPGGFAR